jgi:eukaryotic-like serine/threonine-protein kinase
LPQIAVRGLPVERSSMIGKTISHYRVIEQLGKGGMGEVFLAEDTNLKRQVALKVLPDTFAADPERLARFEREAKLLASLNHPNIADIHGLEKTESGPLLIMELVEGETLAQRISRGPLPVDETLEICRQIAEGLEAAHEKGVIHRDLKPSNIKVTPEGKVKILDFGLAKAFAGENEVSQSADSPTLSAAATMRGVILGTAAYISPEQAKGKAVDKRTDIWAFGCVLYELLTGKQAFSGESVAEILAAVLHQEPDWRLLPNSTPSIRLLLRRCLEKNPARRFRDVADVQIQIEEIQEGSVTDEPSRAQGKNGQRALPWVFGVLAAALATGLTVWKLKPAPPTTAQPPVHVVISLPPGDRLAQARPVVSPDGSHLVYAAIRGDVQKLFVRALDSFEPRSIPGTEGATCPFFSPDGLWIGFFAGGKLKKVSISGGAPITLCDAGGPASGGAAWGPDDSIVFAPSNDSGLWRISAAGGKPQVLTTVDRSKGEFSHRYPQFLPGNKGLLFVTMTGFGWDQYHIFMQSLDTRERRLVVPQGHTGSYIPTGHLVYGRAGTLAAVPFDPDHPDTRGAPVTIAEGIRELGVPGAEYSCSATGVLAYVPAGPRQYERRLVWVDRKGEVEILPVPLKAYGGTALSPDGRQAAVYVESNAGDIWIYDLTRGAWTRFTTEEGGSQNAVWTPDGKRIVYTGFRAGFRNLFWRAADGSGAEERLTKSEHQQAPFSWSPDGTVLAYTDADPFGGMAVWTLRPGRGGNPESLLDNSARQPRFSPDGRWLAYTSDTTGRLEIYVQPFPGPGKKWQISTDGGEEMRWAPNGKELFYRIGNKMMAVDITTEPVFAAAKPRLLFERQFSARGFEVSPDGRRFLMVQAVEPELPATQINLVLNWFEELKRRVPVVNR